MCRLAGVTSVLQKVPKINNVEEVTADDDDEQQDKEENDHETWNADENVTKLEPCDVQSDANIHENVRILEDKKETRESVVQENEGCWNDVMSVSG